MPVRAQFGIKRPAFTWGHGGDASPHIQRPSTNVRKSCAERTMGVALPLPGRGGGISPHMKAFLSCFLKSSPQGLMPARALLGMQHPCCRGRGASSPTKQNPHIQKPLRQFPKYSKLFFNVFCTFFMPVRAQFGIKRPAFTWGHGGDASPHIRNVSPANPRSLYARKGITWDATSTVARGVRRVTLQNKSPRILHIRGRAVNEMRYENSIKKEKNAIAFLKRSRAGRLFYHSACAGLANCLRLKLGLLSN